MLLAVSTFFQTLEDKVCLVCGEKLMEQAESYVNECIACQEQLAEAKTT